jgi:predicted CoA-binding protein
MPLTTDAEIDELLKGAKTIAIVGASDRPDRASYGVMKYAQDRGLRTIPVNPRITGEHVHGEYIWRELAQIGEPIDIVNIFRKSEDVGPVIDEAIAAGAKAVWMQLGISNAEAAAKAEAAGLKVVEDKCLKIELARGNTRVGSGSPLQQR